MKKKNAAILLMVFAIPLLSPALPKAEAAFLEDKIVEAVAGSPTAAQIQEWIKVKDSLGQGNKEVLWGTIAQNAIERTGQTNTINDIANVAAQLTGQDQLGLKENITKVVETTVRSKVQDKVQAEVTNRLAGYQNEIALLSMLLNNSNILTPTAVQNNNSLAGAPQNYSKMLDMTATAYGPGPLDNGKWNNLTYVGGKVKKGVVAVDPNIIPMGTSLWIEGYGQAIAVDQGSAIQGNRVDLAFNTRQEALDYGIKKVKVYVLN